MRAVDTNVLVRLIIGDDPRQTAIADQFVARGAWVSILAIAEVTWVLRRIYHTAPADIAKAVEMLLEEEHLLLQDADTVSAALILFRARPALGFSDCLMIELARKAGHLPLGTFDGALASVDGAERLA